MTHSSDDYKAQAAASTWMNNDHLVRAVMLKKPTFLLIRAILILLLLTVRSEAQFFVASPNLSSTAIGSGFAFASAGTPQVFAAPSPSLSVSAPVSMALWIKTSTLPSSYLALVDAGVSGSNFATGFTFVNSTADSSYPISLATYPFPSLSCAASTCTRQSKVNDGNWHLLCGAVTSSLATLMVDGVVVDQNPTFSYTPNADYWIFGWVTYGSGAVGSVSMRDIRYYGGYALSQQDCQTLFAYGQLGKSPTLPADSFLVSNWSLNNCTGTGCADLLGRNNLLFDQSPPTCAITAPSNGATGLTGNVSLTANASDPVAVTSVAWSVDNVPLATETTSPFGATWATASANKVADGSHTISVTCTNPAGVTATASVSVSTSNGLSNKTFYVAGASGTDSGGCTSSDSPCATLGYLTTQINANPLLGGDSIVFTHGTTTTLNGASYTTELTLLGPNTTVGTQNTFPGKPITITTDSGTCSPNAGTTTGCATITLGNNTITAQTGIINAINVPNLTIQNLILNANGMSNAICSNCLYGVNFGSAGNVTNQPTAGSGSIIQNIETTDLSLGIYVADTLGQIFSTFGPVGGVTVQDNLLKGSARTNAGDYGILMQGCFNCAVQGNVVFFIGGHGGSTGSGILISDANSGPTNTVNKNNVTHDTGANNTACGGPYGNWIFQIVGGAGSGNESYANGPLTFVSGCDDGGFDFDAGVQNWTWTANYSHGNLGNGWLGFIESGWNNNTIFSNVSENDGFGVGGSYAMGNGGDGQGTYLIQFWNNVAYQGNTGNSSNSNAIALGITTCPGPGSVIANNIIAVAPNVFSQTVFAHFFPLVCTSVAFYANDWYAISSTPGSLIWQNSSSVVCNTLSCWQGQVLGGDAGATTNNPHWAGTPPEGAVYSSGNPTAVQPTSYKLTSSSTGLLGAGKPPSSLGVTLPSTDIFGNACPGAMGGTGWNIGADACGNP